MQYKNEMKTLYAEIMFNLYINIDIDIHIDENTVAIFFSSKELEIEINLIAR